MFIALNVFILFIYKHHQVSEIYLSMERVKSEGKGFRILANVIFKARVAKHEPFDSPLKGRMISVVLTNFKSCQHVIHDNGMHVNSSWCMRYACVAL